MGRYKERWGDLNVPRRFWEDWALGIWVSDVRAASRQQWLSPTQTRCLQDMHFSFKLSGVSRLVAGGAEVLSMHVNLHAEVLGMLDGRPRCMLKPSCLKANRCYTANLMMWGVM